MNPSNVYREAAQAYADGVRALFAPPTPISKATSERGEHRTRGPVSPTDLAVKAEQLASLSANLTRATTAQLADADPAARVQASTSLLAKALTDLEISAYLLQVAQDEEEQIAPTRGESIERGVAAPTDIEENLSFLLGREEAVTRTSERSVTALPADLPSARTRLSQTIEDALDLIQERAARTGQAAISGLLTLGVGEIAYAVGVVGMDIAQALGQAEKVTRLYNLFGGFTGAIIGPNCCPAGAGLGQRCGTRRAIREAVGEALRDEADSATPQPGGG